MAVFDTNRSAAPITLSAGFPGMIAKPLAAMMVWNDRRVTRKALMQLTTRELDDIGLSRADIDSI